MFKICTVVVRSRLARAGVEMPAESGAAVVTVIPVDVRRTAGHGFGMALMSGTLWTADYRRPKLREWQRHREEKENGHRRSKQHLWLSSEIRHT